MIKVHFPIHCSEIPNTLQWDLKYTVMRLAFTIVRVSLRVRCHLTIIVDLKCL